MILDLARISHCDLEKSCDSGITTTAEALGYLAGMEAAARRSWPVSRKPLLAGTFL